MVCSVYVCIVTTIFITEVWILEFYFLAELCVHKLMRLYRFCVALVQCVPHMTQYVMDSQVLQMLWCGV